MIKKVRAGLEKLKSFSVFVTNLFVATIAYWAGISSSFLLWKLSQLRRKEVKKTFWLEAENLEEDYKSQY